MGRQRTDRLPLRDGAAIFAAAAKNKFQTLGGALPADDKHAALLAFGY